MARQKLFDRDVALDGAISVFREKGFSGTSTEDLLAAMGISRQSMYDTFGDKRRLYLEALQRYNGASISQSIQALNKAASPVAGLEAMLTAFAKRASEPAHCLGVSSICEFGRADGEVSALNDASGQVLVAALEKAVTAGQAAGEIDRKLDARTAAKFLTSLLAGMKVSARAGASLADLRQIARFALQSLT